MHDMKAEAAAFEEAIRARFPKTIMSRVPAILTLDLNDTPVYSDPVIESAWIGWRLAKELPL